MRLPCIEIYVYCSSATYCLLNLLKPNLYYVYLSVYQILYSNQQ